MSDPNLPATKPASELKPGDRIAADFLPSGAAADVVFVEPYSGARNQWVFVVARPTDGRPDGMPFLADACIPLATSVPKAAPATP